MAEQGASQDGLSPALAERLARQEQIERLLEEALEALVLQLPLPNYAALRAEVLARVARLLRARL